MFISAAGVLLDVDARAMGPGFAAAQEEFFSGFLAGRGGGRPVVVQPAPFLPAAGDGGLAGGLRAALLDVFRRFPSAPNPLEAAGTALDWARLLLGGRRFAQSAGRFLAAGARGVFFPRPQGVVVVPGPSSPAEIHVNDSLPEDEGRSFFREAAYMLLSLEAPAGGSLVLHGAGAVRGGQGYAFLGLSGAGKSTIASLSGDGALSDDGICVRRFGRGFAVEALPFMQKSRRFPAPDGQSTPHPLAGLFFLAKGGPHRVEAIPGPEALGEILHNYIHFFRWFPESICRKAFRLSAGLIRGAGVKRLHFSKDPGFWDVISGSPP